MPGSDPSEHPFVRALDDVIAAYSLMRECGVKALPVDPGAWAAFAAPSPAQAMPRVPPPAQAERPAPGGAPADTPADRDAAMGLLRDDLRACRACAYGAAEGRLLGQGPAYNPDVALVNGAALEGGDPVAVGSRLEGEAGALLDRMLAAIGLARPALYVTHALKCPVSGRPPAEALRACSAHLRRELALVNPRAIVLLGPVAARAVHGSGASAIGTVGQWGLLGRIPTIALHHPMRLLLAGDALSVNLKRENWAALQALRDRLRRTP